MNKPRLNHCVLALLLSGAVLTAPSALALSVKQANELRKAVTSVPVPEMPAKAAELVRRANDTDRKEVTVTVVRAAVSKRRASGPVVVAAISKIAPDLAATAAAAASQIVTDQTSNITQAAIAAAPGQAEAILAAVVVPPAQPAVNQILSAPTTTEASVVAGRPNESASPTVNPGVGNSVIAATATSPTTTPVSGPTVGSFSGAQASSVRPSLPPSVTAGNTPVALARGEADVNDSSSGHVSGDQTPINDDTGGRGDGVFPGFKPSKPPTPHPKPYDRPRS